MKFERRTFLKGSICAGMLVGYGSSASAEKDASERIELSLHQLSVGKLMESGALTLAEYPKFAATTLGVKSIEFDVNYCESLLAAPEKAEALRRTSEHFGVKNRVLLCGNAPALDAPEEAERAAALSQHIQWARLAAQLGCENIRVRASTAGDKTKQLDWAATGIGKLAAQLSSSSVSILIENIGGCSRDPGRLIELAKRLDHERVGLLADFGNFDGDIYTGMEQLLPFTKSICAKSWTFDAEGKETRIDFARMMKVIRNSEYRGCIAIEYLGEDPVDGIQKTAALIRKHS